MSRTRAQPDPRRHCRHCRRKLRRKRFNGRLEDLGAFKRRLFCDQRCFHAAQLASVKPVSKAAHRWRARRHLKAACEECGATEKLHVHHVDEDVTNDDPANLKTLCATCHLKLHWSSGRRSLAGPTRRVPLELLEELEGFAESVGQDLPDTYRHWLLRIVDLSRTATP